MEDRRTIVQGYELRKNFRTGRYDVPVPVPGLKKRRWVTTGETSLERAKKVVIESGVDRMVMLANAGALSAGAMSIVVSGRRVNCAEILEGWLNESGERYARQTLKQYHTTLAAFLEFANCANRPLISLRREKLSEFVNRGGAKRSTRNQRLTALRALYLYAKARNYVLEDMTQLLTIPVRTMTFDQLETTERFPLTDEEYRAIMDSPLTPIFWRVVTSIAFWTGARFVDCACLEWSSISADRLTLWTKKAGKRISVPLDDPLIGAGALRPILAAIPRTDSIYCFPAERAICITTKRNVFPMRFQVILRRLGIEMKTFHSTRHAAITRFDLAGKSLEDIGEWVGHSSPETTRGYIHE